MDDIWLGIHHSVGNSNNRLFIIGDIISRQQKWHNSISEAKGNSQKKLGQLLKKVLSRCITVQTGESKWFNILFDI